MSSGTGCHVVWQIGTCCLRFRVFCFEDEASFSKTSVTIYEATQLHIAEDSDLQRHLSEHLKYFTVWLVLDVMNMKTG